MLKTIETKRLILRPWEEGDAGELLQYAKNPNVGPNAGWKPHENVEESLMIIKELFIPNNVWAIIQKDQVGIVGSIGKDQVGIVGSIGYEDDLRRQNSNSREMGYSLREESWGQGIMTEAGKAVIEYGFRKLGLDMISIQTSPNNLRSQGVIRNCGFTYEGTLRKSYLIYDGSYRDSQIYSLLKEEWEAGRMSDSSDL